MAKYEELGFCPSNSLFTKQLTLNGESLDNSQRVMNKLHDRDLFMVYTSGFTEEPYIADVMFGDDGKLGYQIARILELLIPRCIYPDIGKKILISDVTKDNSIDHSWWEKSRVLTDTRYRVGLQDEDDHIRMIIERQ